jgi:ankyrin repeat protein
MDVCSDNEDDDSVHAPPHPPSSALDELDDFQAHESLFPAWLKARPQLAHAFDPLTGDSVLHCVLRHNDWLGPDHLIQVVNAFPHLIRHANHQGELPIHLFRAGQIVMFTSGRGETGLAWVQYLAECHPHSLLVPDRHGNLPLHRALQRGTPLPVIEYLVKKCPHALKERNKDGMLPMHVAATHSNSIDLDKVLQVLVRKYPQSIQERDALGRIPLKVAVDSGLRRHGVDYLVRRWKDGVRERDDLGNLPLHINYDFQKGKADDPDWSGQIHHVLMKWPDAIYEPNHAGQLPLHCAARLGDYMLVWKLLLHGPDAASVRDRNGCAPIHAAAEAGNPVIQLLDAHPPAVRWRANAGGWLPLHLAAAAHSVFGKREFPFKDTAKVKFYAVEELVEAYPEAVRAATTLGNYLPLHLAAATSTVSTVQYLVEKYPDSLQAVTASKGYTPLHCAFDADEAAVDLPVDQHTEKKLVVEYLVDQRPESLLALGNDGFLPIHCAALRSRTVPCVKVLVERAPDTPRSPTTPGPGGVPPAGGSLPIHLAVARDDRPSYPIVQYMVQQAPSTTLVPNGDGSLPIHLALSAKEP